MSAVGAEWSLLRAYIVLNASVCACVSCCMCGPVNYLCELMHTRWTSKRYVMSESEWAIWGRQQQMTTAENSSCLYIHMIGWMYSI